MRIHDDERTARTIYRRLKARGTYSLALIIGEQMYKRYLIYIFALILILTACNRSEGSSHAAAATQTSPADSIAPSTDTYIYYTADEGLIRVNADGKENVLLFKGAYVRLIGNIDGYIYFTDRDGMLYKMNENGEQKRLLFAAPVADAVAAGGAVCFIQSNELCRLNADDSVTRLMQIPESILQQPYNLGTDGPGLYICAYLEQGVGRIYKCSPESGRIVPQLEDVRYSPLVINKGCAFQAQVTGTGSRIFKQYISSGEKETVLDVTGLLFDMSVSGDWLIYISRPENESQTYVNGFNIISGKAFRLETQSDYIYEALPSQVLLLDSDDKSLSMLKISDDRAYICAVDR